MVRTLCLALFLLALFRASATSMNGQPLGLLDSETALAEVACVQKTCGKYTCPKGYVALPESTVCGRGSCDDCSCCKRTQNCAAWYTASTSKCPSSARLIANANQKYCDKTACTTSECCESLPTCRGYDCGKDTAITPTPTCTSGACSHSVCCQCVPRCDNFNCNGLKKKESPCPKSGCTQQTCCESPQYCNSYRCKKDGSFLKANADKIQCQRGECSDCDCCEERTCANFPCGTNYMLKSGATSIKCPTGTCTQLICCDATCPTLHCPPGYRNNPLATSLRLCPAPGTTDYDGGDHGDHGDHHDGDGGDHHDGDGGDHHDGDGGDHHDGDGGDHHDGDGGDHHDGDGGDHHDYSTSGDHGDHHDGDGGDHHDGGHDGGDHHDGDGGDHHDGGHDGGDRTDGRDGGHGLSSCRMYSCGRDTPIKPEPICGRGACNHWMCCMRPATSSRRSSNCDRGDRSDHHDDHGDHDGGDHHDHNDHDGGDHDGGDHDGGDRDGGDHHDGASVRFVAMSASMQDGGDHDGGDHDGGDHDGGDHDGGDHDGGDHDGGDHDGGDHHDHHDHHDHDDNDDDDDCDSHVGPTPCNDNDNCCIRNSCGSTPSGRAYACPQGYSLVVDAATKFCSGDCTQSECCNQQRAVCNSSFPCSTSGQSFNPMKNGVACAANPCTVDDCCLPKCSTPGKNPCPADRPLIATPTMVRCKASTCLVDECCVKTCASSSIRCLPTQVMVSDYATHQCPRATGDNFGSCAQGDCCINTCTGYRCPSQTSPKQPPAGSTFISCGAVVCGNRDCCVPNNCPATFDCGSGSRPKPSMTSLPCDLATCRTDECCIPNTCRDSGAFAGCPTGYQNKPDFATRACPVGSACRTQDCCNPVCPSGVVCSASKKPVSVMTVCSSGTCSESDCCVDKTCSDYTCQTGTPKSGVAAVACSGTACESLCCLQFDSCFKPNGAIAHCPAGTRDRQSSETRGCGLTCSEADCCVRTCDSWTCGSGKVKKNNPGMIDCARATPADEGTCSDDICCLDTCASTVGSCPSGQNQIADFNTHSCDGGCRSSDCCRDTCALFSCPDYYKPKTSASMTVCSHLDSSCRDVCCQLTVCPNDQSFCGDHYHLKDGQPGCRSPTCSVAECCDENLCFGTFECDASQGWLQNAANPSCLGQDCTTDRCCVHKTCAGYGGCSGGGWEFAPNMASIRCATTACTDQECCVPICNFADNNFCGGGKQWKDSKGAVVHCQSSPCAVTECCEDRTCANTGYSCQQSRFRLKANLNVVCEGPCSDSDCCERIPDTCFDSTGGVPSCIGGFAPKPDNQLPNPCPADLCVNADCCLPTCLTYPCSGAFKDMTAVCSGGECTEEFCCQKFCVDIPGLCAATDIVRDMPCDTCDAATCCLPTCASVTCDQGYVRSVDETFPCGDGCNNDVCCKKVVCDDYQCPPRTHPKDEMANIWCTSGSCHDNDCCNPNTCGAKVCPAGQEVLDRTVSCANLECTDQECCTLITCDGVDYRCQSPLFRQPTLNGCTTHACSDQECCRPKCTAEICPTNGGRRLKSGATDRFCNAMTCTDAECCEDLTCGSDYPCSQRPGMVLTRRPADTKCLAGCSDNVCCLYQAPPGCFAAGSNIQRCDAGWSQKASPRASCDVSGCTMADCCDRTCALDAASLCIDRPQKLSLSSIVCSGGVCLEDDCCDQYCNNPNFRCDAGFKFRDDASTTPCRGDCTNGVCCVPRTCDDYPCAADAVRNVGMVCGTGGCSDSVCCTKTCASLTCDAGYTRRDPTTVCPGGVCTSALCCAATCGSWSCCPGYDLRSDASTTLCDGGACSLGQCCRPNCAAPTFSCNAGSVRKPNAASIPCTTLASSISTSLSYTGYICLQSKCCDSVCTTNTCSSSQRLKAGMLNQPCSGSGNCQDYCCEAKTCANQNVQCDSPLWRMKADYTVISCASCSVDICCERVPYYCSSATCNAGWTRKDGASTMLCPDQQCTNAYCCLPTCQTISCSSFGRPTMAGTGSHVCAATGCAADECCGQYCSGAVCTTPGYVLKTPTPTCSSLTCQQNECCVPSCASYTCTGADKQLMSNPQSQLCSTGPCNDGLCCVNKPCPACGSGYFSKGLSSCTVCDQNECCTQKTCLNQNVGCDAGHQLKSPAPTCLACNQAECCDAICTAAVCQTGYRFEPVQTRCSADPCPTNDAACCKPNVCGNYACGPLQINKAASTQCSGWPCRKDECCYQMDVMCFDANSAIKSCTGGRVPKANAAGIKCANQECTESVCCDETCGSAPSTICGMRPRLTSMNSHVCAQSLVTSTGQTANGCVSDECCGQYCSTDTSLRCSATSVMRDDASSYQCAGQSCTSRECCQDLCKTILCDPNDHMVDANKPCPPATLCTKGYCCATTTCANNVDLKRFTCPAGYVPRPGTNAEMILCMGECNKDICCIPVTCPSDFTCAPGFSPKSSMTSQNCPTGVCQNADCCQLSCKGWLPSNACPVGMRPSFDMATSDVTCAGGLCSSSICCTQNTCTNPDGAGVAFVCAAPTWAQRTDFSTKTCPNAHCTETDCCVPLCGATPQCDAGYSRRSDSATTPCPTGTCSSSVCCTRTMCPSTYRCTSALYVPKPNLSTIPCAGSTCVDKDCCRDQCANINCDAGFTKLASPLPCAGIPCTNAECCYQQTQCPSNYVCNKNPGDVLKHLPQYCAGSTCLYSECCCTGGCNYCGTQFKGTCPVGSKLNLNTNCGAATCTADLCCTGTCLNYPCSNGPSDPSLANAACYNPKQCTDADCCVHWGD